MRGRKATAEKEVKIVAQEELLSDAEYRALIQSLKDQAISGDPVARRQLIELHQQRADAKAMDFVLNIVDYTIDDKSLVSIVKAADTPVVVEILDGLARRLEVDEFSHDLRRILTNFRNLFVEEAETKYAPEEE